MADTNPTTVHVTDDLPGVIEHPAGVFHYEGFDGPDQVLIPTLCGLHLPDPDPKPDWWAVDEPAATCPTCLAEFTKLNQA